MFQTVEGESWVEMELPMSYSGMYLLLTTVRTTLRVTCGVTLQGQPVRGRAWVVPVALNFEPSHRQCLEECRRPLQLL